MTASGASQVFEKVKNGPLKPLKAGLKNLGSKEPPSKHHILKELPSI
jgi:hypothetical protein